MSTLKLNNNLKPYVPNARVLMNDTTLIDTVQDLYAQCIEFLRFLGCMLNQVQHKTDSSYYNSLDEVPRVGEGIIKFNINGELLSKFGVNDINDKIINIEIPVKVSQLSNDAGYLTEHQDISGKANVGDSYTKEESDDKYLTEHQDISGKANVSDLDTLFDDAEYNNVTKKIIFKHGSIPLTEIDATAFIKDGMVNDVKIDTGTGVYAGQTCLIISFNTDAGKSNIQIPLTAIFNPSNYYTKTDIDNKGYLISEEDPTVPSYVKEIEESDITNWNSKVNRNELSAVATTGEYSDLLNLPTIPTVPTNISYFNNDVGYLVLSDISNKADKATSLSGYGILDAKIENGVITLGSNTITPLTQHQDISGKANTADLGAVAFSNDYDDLDNKPTIPVLPTLAEVATSGDYDDLSNKPVYALGDTNGGSAYRTAALPYGECDNTSTATAFTATVPGITELRDGVCVLLRNGVITSASGFTININNLGAKPVYSNMAAGNPVTPTNPTREATTFNINYVILLIYHSTLVSGGCWIFYRGYYYDNNTIGYQLRTNYSIKKTTDACRYYKIFFSSADDTKWVPACANTVNSSISSKTVNQRPINPFGRIVYAAGTTNYAADANIGANAIWDRYNLTLGFSFNRSGTALTLTINTPVYIKCAPQEDGSAIIDADTPYVQTLPTVQDGKIYIYLGMAISATQVELDIYHPIYYYLKEYRGTNYIKQWHGERIKPTIVLEVGTEMIDYSPDAKEGFDNFFDVNVAAYRPNPLEYFNIYFINGFNYADDAYINVSWIRVNTQTKSLYVYNIKENYYYRIYSTTNALTVEYEDA